MRLTTTISTQENSISPSGGRVEFFGVNDKGHFGFLVFQRGNCD
jgi:hypothetical protein